MIDLVQKGAEKVGGLGKLATGLGIRHQAFYSWKKVPSARVLDFERLTGISRHTVRPDIYGPASPTPGAGPDDLDATGLSGPASMEAAE